MSMCRVLFFFDCGLVVFAFGFCLLLFLSCFFFVLLLLGDMS